jgi:CBS-domain-containing membrane protein
MKKLLMLYLVAGMGAAVTIGILFWINTLDQDRMWVIAPFGATTILVFGAPYSEMAQPRNVVFGHILTAIIGLTLYHTLGVSSLSLSLAIGISLVAMLVTRTMHPPAGGNPLIIMLTDQSWSFLLTPIVIGVCTIAFFGWAVRKAREKYVHIY